MFDGWDVKHAKMRIVHPLTVPNFNAALNDVDSSMLHLFNELDGFCEKHVVVPLLVADVSLIFRLTEPSQNDWELFVLQAENACAHAHPAPAVP